MTKDAIKMFKENDFSPDSIKDLHISFETMLTQVPIVIKNSHLINALLLDMQEKLPLSSGGAQYLDLGTATTLETQIRSMMDSVDELNQESIKFNKHQNLMLKQFQEKSRFIQKRQLENQARQARGEDPLPDEDISKVFKNVPAPSRLNPLILSGTIAYTADEVTRYPKNDFTFDIFPFRSPNSARNPWPSFSSPNHYRTPRSTKDKLHLQPKSRENHRDLSTINFNSLTLPLSYYIRIIRPVNRTDSSERHHSSSFV